MVSKMLTFIEVMIYLDHGIPSNTCFKVDDIVAQMGSQHRHTPSQPVHYPPFVINVEQNAYYLDGKVPNI